MPEGTIKLISGWKDSIGLMEIGLRDANEEGRKIIRMELSKMADLADHFSRWILIRDLLPGEMFDNALREIRMMMDDDPENLLGYWSILKDVGSRFGIDYGSEEMGAFTKLMDFLITLEDQKKREGGES